MFALKVAFRTQACCGTYARVPCRTEHIVDIDQWTWVLLHIAVNRWTYGRVDKTPLLIHFAKKGAKEGTFTRTYGSDNGQQVTRFYVQVDIAQCGRSNVVFPRKLAVFNSDRFGWSTKGEEMAGI